jgi:hypothetical protein
VAKDDQEEAFEKLLSASLARNIDLLKFAETKNAALLAFSSAWLVALGNAQSKTDGVPGSFSLVVPLAIALFLAATLLAIYSFLPRVKLSSFHTGEAAVSRPLNLLFYDDVKRVTLAEYPAKLRTRYLPSKGASATADYLDDLACQIHVNSSIASRKYAIFKVAAWLVLAALALLSLPALKWLLATAIKQLAGA